MIIVGIYGAYDWDANKATDNSDYVHDSGCTLFVDGKHIASVNEERITREKYEGNFPRNSIDYCLDLSLIHI